MPITNDSPTDPRRRVRVAPGVFLRGGRYSVSYTDDEGLHHHKTTEAKNITEAKAIREKKRVAVREGTAVSPSKVTFAEVTVEYLAVFGSLVSAGERSPRTLERYRENIDRHLLPAFGRREIQKIKPDAVARFLNEKRSAGLSAWSRKGMLTPLRRIFGLAVRRGYISESPLRRLDPSELPKGQNQTEARVLSRDELAALVQHTPETYRPVIATLALTGMRIQEALGLVWSDIDFEAGVIRLCYQLTRATRAEPASCTDHRGVRRG